MTNTKSGGTYAVLIALATILVAVFSFKTLHHFWGPSMHIIEWGWGIPAAIGVAITGFGVSAYAWDNTYKPGTSRYDKVISPPRVLRALAITLCSVAVFLTTLAWPNSAYDVQHAHFGIKAIHHLAATNGGKITFDSRSKRDSNNQDQDGKFSKASKYGASEDLGRGHLHYWGPDTVESALLDKYYHGDDLKKLLKNDNTCVDALDGRLCVHRHGNGHSYTGSYTLNSYDK